jgi:osmotically-inducible protein OsmY
MPNPTRLYSPSVDTSASTHHPRPRPSLYDTKDEFIERISPVATAIIFFGNFSLTPQGDAALSQQALFKLSFLNRHFLQHGGLKVKVNRQTATLSGTLNSPLLFTMGEILALQLDGINQVKNETSLAPLAANLGAKEAALEAIQFLFATDQTLRTGVRASLTNGHVVLDGSTDTLAQKNWAEQLATAAGGSIESRLAESTVAPAPSLKVAEPPQVDDESLEALVLFRLRLLPETKDVAVKVKASRGVLTLQGKAGSEALRQRTENIARSTLGVRELRSSVSIAG